MWIIVILIVALLIVAISATKYLYDARKRRITRRGRIRKKYRKRSYLLRVLLIGVIIASVTFIVILVRPVINDGLQWDSSLYISVGALSIVAIAATYYITKRL